MALSSSHLLPFAATSHPEIEMSEGYDQKREISYSSKTSVDILEIPQGSNDAFNWLESLDHDALLSHFEASFFFLISI